MFRPDVFVLVGEELPGPAEPGLHLVADQQRPVLVQQRGRLAEEPGGRHHHAMPLHRLDDHRGYVTPPQLRGERVQVAEGDLRVGQQRPEPAAELLRAVHRERPGGQPVERVARVNDPPATGRVPRELQRGLDRLGAAVAEEHPVQARRLGQQPLREQPGDRLTVELGPGGEVRVERVVQRLLDHRVAAARREHPESGQEVRVRVSLGVVEVGAVTAHVVLVEPDRVQRARQLRIQVAAVQVVALSPDSGEFRVEVKTHGRIMAASRGAADCTGTRRPSTCAWRRARRAPAPGPGAAPRGRARPPPP